MGKAIVLKGACIVGDVTLKEDVSVWYHAVLRGDMAPIVILEKTNIQDNAVLHVDTGYPLLLGKGVTVGHGAILHGCTVGDNTVIGMGAIVLNGANIGSNCIIGAGALVTQNTVIPDGSLVIGSPGKIRRNLTNEEIEHNRSNAQEYLKLSQKYAEEGHA